MRNNSTPSPKTSLTRAAAGKLARLGGRFLCSVLTAIAAVLAGFAVMYLAWTYERQAREREVAEAKQVKKQAAQEISRLRQQAADALRDAKHSAEAVRRLEDQRQQIAREAEELRRSLDLLRRQEIARTDEVATLSTQEVVSRVASRLREQAPGSPLTRPTRAEEQVLGARGQGPGLPGISDSRFEIPDRRGIQDSRFKIPDRLSSKVNTQHSGEPAGASEPALVLAGAGVRKSEPALVLSGAEARKVETAFIDLDSCREQALIMGQQNSNCDRQAKLDAAIHEQDAGAIVKLNQALADKDQIIARSEEARRAELKAARGTWQGRFKRAAEIFAGGLLVGVIVR